MRKRRRNEQRKMKMAATVIRRTPDADAAGTASASSSANWGRFVIDTYQLEERGRRDKARYSKFL